MVTRQSHNLKLVGSIPAPGIEKIFSFYAYKCGVLYIHKFVGGRNLFILGFTLILLLVKTKKLLNF